MEDITARSNTCDARHNSRITAWHDFWQLKKARVPFSGFPSGLDFIAVGNRSISQGVGVFKHLSLEYYVSDLQVATFSTFNKKDFYKDAKDKQLAVTLTDGVELFPDNDWHAPHFAGGVAGGWSYKKVSISVIHFGKGVAGDELTIIFSDLKKEQGEKEYTKKEIKEKWDQIVIFGKFYAYAEQQEAIKDPTGKSLKHWPNSLYPANPGKQIEGNNSNTFVYWLMRQVGVGYSKLPIGWRNAGSETPRPYIDQIGRDFAPVYFAKFTPSKLDPLPKLPIGIVPTDDDRR